MWCDVQDEELHVESRGRVCHSFWVYGGPDGSSMRLSKVTCFAMLLTKGVMPTPGYEYLYQAIGLGLCSEQVLAGCMSHTE